MIKIRKLADIKSTVQQAIHIHGASRDALIPILSEVNKVYGYIPKEAIIEIKNQLHETDSRVFASESQLFGLASFYHMFSTKPLGKHVVRFCESAPCHVMGGRQVLQSLQEVLNLKPGETSSDGNWSFITTSCLGICGVGPVIMVDDDIYGNVTPEDLKDILSRYK